MANEDSTEWAWVKGFFGGLWVFLMLWVWLISPADIKASHRALATKGRACFANHTCREGLHCLLADGIEEPGVCVK